METKVEETRSEAEEMFQRFATARLPEHLKGEPVEGSIAIEADREASIAASRSLWNEQLSAGYTARELAGIDRWPESSGGRPVRPLPSTVPEAAMSQASQALRELRRRSLSLDPQLMVHLEDADRGVFTSAPVSLRGAIAAAHSACSTYDANLVTARREEATLIPVEALPCSRGTVGPLHLRPGPHKLTAEQLEQMHTWVGAEEEKARRQGRPYPDGFNRSNWPPFVEPAAI